MAWLSCRCFIAQATAVETKEDRNIICSEVFNDITGSVDLSARSTPYLML
jgi:hypothetical protein